MEWRTFLLVNHLIKRTVFYNERDGLEESKVHHYLLLPNYGNLQAAYPLRVWWFSFFNYHHSEQNKYNSKDCYKIIYTSRIVIFDHVNVTYHNYITLRVLQLNQTNFQDLIFVEWKYSIFCLPSISTVLIMVTSQNLCIGIVIFQNTYILESLLEQWSQTMHILTCVSIICRTPHWLQSPMLWEYGWINQFLHLRTWHHTWILIFRPWKRHFIL